MKILLLGVFSQGSTDTWKVLALQRLGHRVFPFPYRDRDWRELNRLGEAWDLVFVSKGTPGLPIEAFERLTEISKARLLWWPDPFENWTDVLSAAMRANPWHVAGTSRVVLEKIQDEANAPSGDHMRRILEGCDCEGPRPDWQPKEIRPALLHFGHLSERRQAIIDRLQFAGVPVDHLAKPVYGAALQRLVLSYAAVLGINSSPDLYSNRVQTVLAMGGNIIQESAPGIEEDFEFSGAAGPAPNLLLWREDVVVGFAQMAIAEMDRRSRMAGLRVFERFRWEHVMERAIQFACGVPT